MFKVSITKNGILTNQGMFATEAEANTWVAEGKAGNWWGLPEREVELEPAVMGMLPAEFEVVVADVSEQVAQEQINQRAREYLKETDWLIIREMDEGIPCPLSIKEARAAARSRIV